MKHSVSIMICAVASLLAYTLCLSAQTDKLSPLVRRTYLEYRASERSSGGALLSKSRNNAQEAMMHAFVKTGSPDVLRREGCRVLASFGDIHIVTLPLARISAVASLSQVERIEAGAPCSVTNDDAAAITHAESLHSGLSEYTGEGVVVGVMDIGIDLTHPTFRTADGGACRIKSFWDMLDQTADGEPVMGVDTTYVGRQYNSEAEILAKGCSADGHLSGHGTHTAGTAAGSGRNEDGTLSDYAGMAPAADLCLVSNATSLARQIVPAEDIKKYNTALDALGFKYIFDYAESQGKPCVISFSEGSHQDMEGENRLFNDVLKAMQGQGRIIVSSAGNEGDKNTYIRKKRGTATAGAFVQPASTGAYYVMRSDDKMTLRVTFYTATGEPIVREYHTDDITACKDSILADTLDISTPRQVVLLNAYPYVHDETKWATELYVTTEGAAATVGKDVPVSVTLMGDDIEVEAFSRGGYFTNNALDTSLNAAEASHCILSPGALEATICVGGVNKSYTAPVIASWSGRGPSVEGLVKPDVVAPGSGIVSAQSKAYYGSYGWRSNSGTSMSTPVVGGIVALWLQACPTLTREQALEAIAATSSHPDASLDYPNNTYGYGMIDAEAGLQYILDNFTGVVSVPSTRNAEVATYYNLQGMRVKTPRAGCIYIVNGRKLKKE